MPRSHQAYLEWTPQRLVQWAEQAGGSTADVVKTILATRAHPQQGFRSCLGIMRLSQQFGPQRLEGACAKALSIGSLRYKSILSILDKKLDLVPLSADELPKPDPLTHHNIRGAAYYQDIRQAVAPQKGAFGPTDAPARPVQTGTSGGAAVQSALALDFDNPSCKKTEGNKPC